MRECHVAQCIPSGTDCEPGSALHWALPQICRVVPTRTWPRLAMNAFAAAGGNDPRFDELRGQSFRLPALNPAGFLKTFGDVHGRGSVGVLCRRMRPSRCIRQDISVDVNSATLGPPSLVVGNSIFHPSHENGFPSENKREQAAEAANIRAGPRKLGQLRCLELRPRSCRDFC